MRTLALATLLAATAHADEAADLFYRAFWLEQSGRGNAEAEKLYRELIEKHGDAPEAPRAYLALIRMRSAKGVKVDDMLKALEKGYPAAKQEIDLARKLAARLNVDFDAQIHADDSPLQRKLKTIYTHLLETGKVARGDEDFLQDVGAAGHTMLAAALRSSNGSAVYLAARSLARQKSGAATRVLIRALQDDSVLYRLRIIDSFSGFGFENGELVAALYEIWPRASRSMRRRITAVWARGTMAKTPSAKACYRYLATALADEDEQVRASALAVDAQPPFERPAVWVDAAMRLVSTADSRAHVADSLLPWQVGHAELRPKIERNLIERAGPIRMRYLNLQSGEKHGITEAMAQSWVRIVLARSAREPSVLEQKNQPDATRSLAWFAVFASNDAARALLTAGLERGSGDLVEVVRQGLQQRQPRKRWDPAVLGDLAGFKRLALEQSYDEDKKKRSAAAQLLRMFPLDKQDSRMLIEVVQAHPGKGVPAQAISRHFFGQIGPEAAAALVPHAQGAEIAGMLAAGFIWTSGTLAREDYGLPFWNAIVPRTGAEDAAALAKLDRFSPQLAALLAARTLAARGQAWKWQLPSSASRYSGVGGALLLGQSGVLAAFRKSPLKEELYAAAGDERREIGDLALRIAEKDPSDAALAAYRAAFGSPWASIREWAIRRLSDRGEQGAAQLETWLKQDVVAAAQRDEVLKGLRRAAGKEQLPYALQRLDARPKGREGEVMWSIAFQFDRDATIDRALTEVFGAGPEEFRDEALQLLCRVSDPRRIEVFRKVLRSDRAEERIHRVLRTVADQYLIELGPEVLLHLRNPNNGIRQTATKAIERLKFYAEAKKLFDKQKPKEAK